jgi:AraC family transcriptional regulator
MAPEGHYRSAPPPEEPRHLEIARRWCGQDGVMETSILHTPSATAAIVECDNDYGRGGDWLSDVHYIDMCLTQRPKPARSCFVDQSNEYRETGRIFLAPAGRRVRFEGSAGRQRALGLFLPASPLVPVSEDGDDRLSGVLSQCLHIWSESIRTPLKRIAEEVRNPGFASPLIVEGLSLVILGELSRLLQRPKPNLGSTGGLPSWRLNLIEEMVRAEGRAPTLAEIAGACRMSTRHLTRAFRKETGLTLGTYVEQVTIERAKQMLRESQTPIATIAANTGFATPAGFSAAFRRATGQTPRSFRAREAVAA